jgi:hypothetical protein
MNIDTLTLEAIRNSSAVRRRVEAFLQLARLAQDPHRADKRLSYLQQALNTLNNLFCSATSSLVHFAQDLFPRVYASIQALYDAATGTPKTQLVPVPVPVSWIDLY